MLRAKGSVANRVGHRLPSHGGARAYGAVGSLDGLSRASGVRDVLSGHFIRVAIAEIRQRLGISCGLSGAVIGPVLGLCAILSSSKPCPTNSVGHVGCALLVTSSPWREESRA